MTLAGADIGILSIVEGPSIVLAVRCVLEEAPGGGGGRSALTWRCGLKRGVLSPADCAGGH
eukprot:CAMPEP_0173362820 /NCGR_PEP_ID=MMETSP1144-20121109/22034_1 /TAXON_ID=483371 /ORGANISM="non described non described, Strain CCMP2298" /LENGTH=60 /DNA_ID=CAMNT_0014312685 /DNA_START=242 /DNA_END=421 /DNA_ORIENTATION=-